MRVLNMLFVFLLSHSVAMAWVGTYANTSQQGMAVEFNAQGEYWVYIVQNGQAISLELGQLQLNETQIYFYPSQTASGQLNNTMATITQTACAFNWGEAGEFRNINPECQTQTQTANMTSLFSASDNQLVIPQLGLPNGSGGFSVFKLTLALISMSPVSLQLVNAEPISNPVNALSAL